MVRGECRRGANKESEEPRSAKYLHCSIHFNTSIYIYVVYFWIYGLHSGVSQVSALLGGENSDIE